MSRKEKCVRVGISYRLLHHVNTETKGLNHYKNCKREREREKTNNPELDTGKGYFGIKNPWILVGECGNLREKHSEINSGLLQYHARYSYLCLGILKI